MEIPIDPQVKTTLTISGHGIKKSSQHDHRKKLKLLAVVNSNAQQKSLLIVVTTATK